MKLNVKAALKSLLVTVLSLFAVVGVLNAATTIGENITTAGTLAVTGASTFTGSIGAINLTTGSSTGLVKVNSLRVGPNSTESPTVSGMVFGTCNFKTDETLDISLTTASTTYLVCGDATGVCLATKSLSKQPVPYRLMCLLLPLHLRLPIPLVSDSESLPARCQPV